MSKRSLGSKAAQAKGAKIHKEQKARHQEKLRRKYDNYCKEIMKEGIPGLLPATFEVWSSWIKANDSPKKIESLTDLVNEMGVANEEEK